MFPFATTQAEARPCVYGFSETWSAMVKLNSMDLRGGRASGPRITRCCGDWHCKGQTNPCLLHKSPRRNAGQIVGNGGVPKHAEPAENYWSTWIRFGYQGENIAVDDSLALAFETLANLTSFA